MTGQQVCCIQTSQKKSVETKVEDIRDLLNSMITQIEKKVDEEKDEKKVAPKKKTRPQSKPPPPPQPYQNGTALLTSSSKVATKRKYSSNNTTTSVDSSDSEVASSSSPRKTPKLANLSNNETNNLLLTNKKQNGNTITNGHDHKVTNGHREEEEEDMDVENIENSNKTKKASSTKRKRTTTTTTSSAVKDEDATKSGFLPGFIQINEACVAQRQKERFEQNCRCLDLQTHYPNRTTTDLGMCRECCAALSSPNDGDVVNVCCRFEGWRLLRIDKQTNELKADGFLGLDDAKEHDNELWCLGEPSSTTPPSESERKVCAKLLETIGNDFKSLIEYELKMAKDYTKECIKETKSSLSF
jgi:hypothetical protein